MTLAYTPEINRIVLDACRQLIDQYGFTAEQKAKNETDLVSKTCGIKIIAGISPLGERTIRIDFYDPRCSEPRREYYSHTLLMYLRSRAEPWDIISSCPQDKDDFDETLQDALQCFAAHTLKYRKDILEGDFTTWIPYSTR